VQTDPNPISPAANPCCNHFENRRSPALGWAMRRRSRASSKLANARNRKAKTLTVAPHSSSSATGQETEAARFRRERDEALEREIATAEVLKVINSSAAALEPVFNTILENATRICEAKFGTLFLRDGEALRFAAEVGTPRELAEFNKRRKALVPTPGSLLERVLRTKQIGHTADAAADPFPGYSVKLGGARAIVCVPMLKDDHLVGVIIIYRQEVRPFSDKQIALVQNFAAQAVIAIENARLLNELRQRTTDLTESLEQQTATSEVLKVISSSPGELEPVFLTVLENAVKLCEAKFGTLFLFDGTCFRVGANCNVPAPLADFQVKTGAFVPPPGLPLARLVETKKVAHMLDDPERVSPATKLGGARTHIAVPMLKEGEISGAIYIYRQEVKPFTDKQIALVQNFAAQAVIAIENTRLLNELRQSLEQQTATSEVLGVISRSPGELEPVFESILANAMRLCEANFGFLHLYENGKFRTGARYKTSPAFAEDLAKRPLQPGPLHPLMRMAATKQLLHISDYAEDIAYKQHDPMAVRLVELAGAHTLIEVPMLKEGELIGAVAIYRREVRPFTDKQIALVQNFAAQAVIAIENARLLNELRQRTDQIAKLNEQLEQRVTDQVGEIERMGRLRRFLPPQVADLIVASGTEKQLESHRREITALFCDLRGFTGFSESSDPEDVMALLAEYHAAIGEIIFKYSGTLERYAGDGVMVIFNDPVPVENPALQAVFMALEMRTAIEALMAKWRLLGHDIGFGIGIAHGFATLGTIGFEGRRDYAAIGTVSNVASRLCDEAKPGQILISPRVMLAVDKAITVEPVGEFALKGIRRPMMTYNVLETLPSKPN
jgi:GAF domain-containing protein